MIAGVLLAGGQASRLGGGDKGLHQVGGQTILERIVASLAPQCRALVLNANGDPARFATLGLPVVADAGLDRPGPLAGVLAGLDYVAMHHPDAAFALTVPTDAPFLPPDLVARLVARTASDPSNVIVCAASGGRPHYVTALWSVGLRHDLRRALVEDPRVSAFYERHATARVEWPTQPHDPFFNVNTQEDLAEAERIAASIDD